LEEKQTPLDDRERKKSKIRVQKKAEEKKEVPFITGKAPDAHVKDRGRNSTDGGKGKG